LGGQQGLETDAHEERPGHQGQLPLSIYEGRDPRHLLRDAHSQLYELKALPFERRPPDSGCRRKRVCVHKPLNAENVIVAHLLQATLMNRPERF
jgi:hypothetical protein